MIFVNKISDNKYVINHTYEFQIKILQPSKDLKGIKLKVAKTTFIKQIKPNIFFSKLSSKNTKI